jgi:C-terminal processing protease CtpA/Prc
LHAGHAQHSNAHPRADVAPAQQQQQVPPQQMGGVGLVFYRDSSSPYLVVKDVVHDGPAFRSSLIYPGDKLCCINDFDLAWSEKTPRSQQPQLPGAHGSSVALTFDRSVDPACPARFTVTLMRNMGFYPGLL